MKRKSFTNAPQVTRPSPPTWTSQNLRSFACIHQDLDYKGVPIGPPCGKVTRTDGPHGFLCFDHDLLLHPIKRKGGKEEDAKSRPLPTEVTA